MAELYCDDCLNIMSKLPENSIDMIFTDLPYGTTQNVWDKVIDFEMLWDCYKRVIKENGCIALFAQFPFDKILACSNLKWFRYEWIIVKKHSTGFLNANKMPLKAHEFILIFYKHLPKYHPIKMTGFDPVHSYTKKTPDGPNYGKTKLELSGGGNTDRFPIDILNVSWDTQKMAYHPQQKPYGLCKYIIQTYTDKDDIVLDNCMGSGTIGVAAENLNRSYIGIEKEKCFYEIAKKRIG